MTKRLVTLVNPNKLHPGVAPYALDILTTGLEQGGFDVEVVDLTFERHRWRDVLQEYFGARSPLLVGITLRNTDTLYAQDQRVFLPEHLEIISAIRQLTRAPVVGGGVGFSSMSHALTEYFGLDYAVRGPGEKTITQLASALSSGAAATTVPGLIMSVGGKAVQNPGWGQETLLRNTPFSRRSNTPGRVDNGRYYREAGLGNILFKNGCPFKCAHCVEPSAKGDSFQRRQTDAVVDELEALAAQGVLDVHSTDSEVNFSIKHTKEILQELARRRRSSSGAPINKLRLWLYCQPAPFDPEFGELLAAAGCAGINFGSDHTVPKMLAGWKVTESNKTWYDYAQIKEADRICKSHGIKTMHDVLIGMPGENEDTLKQCVDETLALESTCVGYSVGMRLFPYSPIGLRMAKECNGQKTVPGLQSNTAQTPIVLRTREQCASQAEYERQFTFDDQGRIRPVFYFSPELPESRDTVAAPDGRWARTLDVLRDLISPAQMHRVMMPTLPGNNNEDNNFADSPFLVKLTKLGYTGAYWSHFPHRDEVMQQTQRTERDAPGQR